MYCKKCNQELNKESFSKGCSNCKDCERKRLSEYYKNNKKKYSEKAKERNKSRTHDKTIENIKILNRIIKNYENITKDIEFLKRRLKSEQV